MQDLLKDSLDSDWIGDHVHVAPDASKFAVISNAWIGMSSGFPVSEICTQTVCLCHCHRRTKFLLLHPQKKGLVINAIGSITYMFFKSSLHGILLTHHGHMLIMDIMDLNEQCHAENGNLWISPISKDVRDASHESFVRDFVPGYLSYEDVEAQRDGDVFLMLNPLKSNIDIRT